MKGRILVITQNEAEFRRYFHPQLFKRLNQFYDIRGISDTVLIRFGWFWRSPHYDECERELLDYCHSHNITVVDIEEPSNGV